MNVPFLMVSGDFVKTGGMDRANYALTSYLSRQGHTVELVAHRVDAELLSRDNVTFRRVPKPLNSYLLGEPLLGRVGRACAKRMAKLGGRVVVNGGNCAWGDVNWVHYVHAAWNPRTGGGPLRRAKQVYASHSARFFERRVLQTARVVVANSEQTRTALIERLNLDPARVHTVYYGTDPSQFRPASLTERTETRIRLGWNDERPTLAFVGALGDLRKGIDTLLAAWKISKSDPAWDARLVVIGAGASGPLQEQMNGMGVEWMGFRRDVPDILRGCDALVSPTRYEAYGLNVQEALCCGLPALVSRAAGVAERYPKALEGLLIDDPEDPIGLAERLRFWRQNRESLAGPVAGLSEQLRSYTWDDMAERFLEVITSAG